MLGSNSPGIFSMRWIITRRLLSSATDALFALLIQSFDALKNLMLQRRLVFDNSATDEVSPHCNL
jgi:hypothetical protein